MNKNNIYPHQDMLVSRGDFENRLSQHGLVVWLVGLSGSGKSTIAKSLKKRLFDEGFLVRLLDGDNMRLGLNNNLGFSDVDRYENIRRTAEAARLFKDTGIVTLVAAITPTHKIQKMTREIIGEDDLFVIYISTPVEECERRDVKGLYKKARAGEIASFTGISDPFEEPQHPQLTIDTTNKALDESVDEIIGKIIHKIRYNGR
ncbi:MAG: adenylyl-sulfate kinase [Rikenellaceae bacterium]